ncbi:protein kinase [candidate division KSB1 bacterium]|nr:protein kinase [candidate division KSB1 bacterium]NIR71333.1 protein kinase [candidate division KSB1 bacterium]NIS26223.1 protein kinase [candidate division KSB1 bacterium]NIT74653.1 protein kinase [candidate division KSB1 bacterium]NIU26871.1 protein kinase [candidate division KSB1 bacterium]
MDYNEKWEIIDELGEGGQGKVYRVIPKSMGYPIDMNIIHTVKEIGNPNSGDDYRRQKYELFRKSLFTLLERENSSNHKALKVLHKPEEARDAELAEERIKNEIKAMAEITHPNLLKIVEYDLDSKWFVSEYFLRGSVSKNRDIFAGNFSEALKAFRPLVEGVAELHKKNIVHRDIKPENVFLDSSNKLVLGDFGLVFFNDDDKTRISKTLENVGSRDWMPAWAQGVRIEDIKPTFDVFSLGKLLWSLVSGLPKLLLWYFDKPQDNVESLFPEDRFIKFANPLLRKCIVEDEENCLPDASALLEEIDEVLSIIENNADRVDLEVERRCKVCGVGHYELIVNEDTTGVSNFGFTPSGDRRWKIFTCSHCGNVQLFSYEGKPPDAW